MMSPIILESIRNWIRSNLDLGTEKTEEIATFFSTYTPGKWLYPGVLVRRYHLTTIQAYSLLDFLEQESVLESYYELSCGSCQKTTGTVYRTISELPNTFCCESCSKTNSAMENASIIYKVRENA